MGIGDDLSTVFEEVGTSCTIIKSDGTEFEEYFDYEAFPDHSTVFIRQNCYAGTFAYNSAVEDGDTVLFSTEAVLVMNRKQELFEDTDVVQNTYLIQCNTTTGVLQRKVETRGTNYKNTVVWSPAITGIHGLHYASSQDREALLLSGGGSVEQQQHTLYISSSLDVKIGDRWIPSVSEQAYEIKAITDLRYSGLHVCTLEEDL